jgi:imidazolonepropionase-like amidohydrolase
MIPRRRLDRAVAPAAALAALAAPAALWAAVPTPGPPQREPIAIVGATLHTISGQPIPGGTLVLADGRITALGAGVAVPPGARRIDAAGRHVYPGLVEAHSRLGLVEIEAVRPTRDYNEVGDITPNVKSWVAVNPESEVIPVTRTNGVLLAAVAPSGTLLQGQSAMLMLDGWTWDDMTLAAPIALHLAWPSMSLPRGPEVRETREKLEQTRQKKLVALENAFLEARAYWTARRAAGDPPGPGFALDARWESMVPLFEKEIPLVVAAGEIRQIEAAVAFARRHDVRLVVLGGEDAPRVAELLRENDVAVIVDGTHRLPGRRHEAFDDAFTVPDRLYRAGVRFCLAAGGPFYIERNLAYQAGTAAAYGLPHDEAVRAITLYPAQILGVADRVGSLEVGKDASLIVTDGDVLEITTRVEAAFLQGREVDLSNRQTVLYDKYREKYRRLGLLRE